jgi:hypothetical protein
MLITLKRWLVKSEADVEVASGRFCRWRDRSGPVARSEAKGRKGRSGAD